MTWSLIWRLAKDIYSLEFWSYGSLQNKKSNIKNIVIMSQNIVPEEMKRTKICYSPFQPPWCRSRTQSCNAWWSQRCWTPVQQMFWPVSGVSWERSSLCFPFHLSRNCKWSWIRFKPATGLEFYFHICEMERWIEAKSCYSPFHS